jgi:regulator of protease activity HflC (stomatin/prohibitin superfamily)
VHDAEKAALAITDYRQAMDRVAQTSLREMIGSSVLATLLSDRKQADEQLKTEIGAKTAPWGLSVCSVEIRDVAFQRPCRTRWLARPRPSARSRRA